MYNYIYIVYTYVSTLYMKICISLSLSLYISADLFQSSSVLDYSCNPPTPSCRLQPHHPADCILLCRDCRIQPTLHHLKGAALICHSPPQAATGCHRLPDLEPSTTPPWP